MRRTWTGVLAVVVTLSPCHLVTLSAERARAAEEMPYAGTWKVTVQQAGAEISFCLVKITRDGRFTAEVTAVAPIPAFKGLKAGPATADAKSLAFDLKNANADFTVKVYAPKGGEKPKVLAGTLRVRGNYLPLELVRTDLESIDAKSVQKPMEGRDELFKAAQEMDGDEREKLFAELTKKGAGKPIELTVYQFHLNALVRDAGIEPKKVEPLAEKLAQLGSRFGPEFEMALFLDFARAFSAKEKLTPLGLGYAQKAAKMLRDDQDADTQATVLKVLAACLRKAGKKEEADKLAPRLAKLDRQLDAEFAKNAVPFKPEKFAGRKGKSQRVVLVELFTGAQCPPCVAADVAFDAALLAYPAKDVALLQYHLHIPGPDPMTNEDTLTRAKYYGDNLRGCPTAFVDGKVTSPLGGGKPAGKKSYATLGKLLDAALETDAEAKVNLKVTRQGDRLDIAGEVDGLGKPGENLRLRFVLVEDVVHWAGSNGQRLHHHVVRALPGGTDGFKLEKKDDNKHTATVQLGDLRGKLGQYLKDYSKKGRGFGDDTYPLELKKLKVVAFVQNDDDKTILQAVQADVPEEK